MKRLAAAWLSAIHPRRSERDERGFAGGFEGLLFGLVIFVVGTSLAAYAWAVVDTKTAVEDAARQGARTLVQAQGPQAGATAARQAALETLAGLGRDPSAASVVIDSSSFGRCVRVTVTVSYRAPLLLLPWFGRVGSGHIVSAKRSELVDAYRSGLPGEARCA